MGIADIRVTPDNARELIEAVEEDLRGLILVHLAAQKTPNDVLSNECRTKCIERFVQENRFLPDNPTLDQLLPYADFPDLYMILNANRELLPGSTAQHMRQITPQLEQLVQVRNRLAHNRPLLYADCELTDRVSKYLAHVSDNDWHHVTDALMSIATRQSSQQEAHTSNLPIPDFEETGYIGRKKQVEDLLRLCLQSPYPVITIFGDGGVGKTALALKVAYDLLALPDCPFEAIIWASSKTQQLTPQEIARVDSAIRDSLGMVQYVSDQLAPSGIENPIAEVLTYLAEFRILLIFDNLETVLDDTIRQFLGNLPYSGSKVLITSRIAVGAYEYPFRLKELDESEAVQLLRALADIRQVPELVKMPNEQLRQYCKRMKNSPLAIKWFVSAVQSGRRPEEILAHQGMLLDFCMSDVYGFLREDSRHVLNSMLSLPGRHSQAELAFLNDMDVLDLEAAMRELCTTTMVTMISKPRGASYETFYELPPLARDYLAKYHPVAPPEEWQLRKRQRQLVAAMEEMSAERDADPYSFRSISWGSQSDVIIAKYLLDALGYAQRGEFSDAETAIAKARNLAPSNFEVYRVEAFVSVKRHNYSAAQTAYEAAIELNPTSAPLRVWYGGFLMRYLSDTKAALQQFEEARRLDGSSPQVQVEITRAYLYLRRFDDCRAALDQLLQHSDQLKPAARRKLYDLNIQFYVRQAEYLISQRDKVGAYESLLNVEDAYRNCPAIFVDDRTRERLGDAIRLIPVVSSALQDEAAKGKAQALLNWLYDEVSKSSGKPSAVDLGPRLTGIIANLPAFKNFGFLQGTDGNRYFFHRANLADPAEWPDLKVGDRVAFWTSNVTSGPTPSAMNLMRIDNDKLFSDDIG